MKFSEAVALFDQISHATKDMEVRKLGVNARLKSYQPFIGQISKQAFDTRRVDQVNDRNPRGNLQYYHRSEPFIDEDLSNKIGRYMKIKSATDMIKDQYGTDPEWFDSYARILSGAVDRTLRTDQKDGDFFKAAFEYLDELLYVRYRLSKDDIEKKSETEIEKIVLAKDEKLMHKHIYKMTSRPRPELTTYTSLPTIPPPSTDPLVERLLDGVKATGLNRDVERSITISVRDKINEPTKTGESQ
jgi:hypothetical protein